MRRTKKVSMVHRAAWAAGTALLASVPAFGADADWALSGSWGTASWGLDTKWTTTNATPLPPDAAGVSVLISTNFTGVPSTISLDGTRTMGSLRLGDSDIGELVGVTIAAGTPSNSLLVFNNNGAGATLTNIAGFNTIATGIRMDDNLTLDNTGTNGLTITGPVTSTGTRTLTFTGTGASNFTFSGLINHTGTIENARNTTGAQLDIFLNGGVGPNVYSINQTGTSSLRIAGNLEINAGGTTISNSSTTRVLNLTGGITGTGGGNLVLINNALNTLNGGIGVSTGVVNFNGYIINTGGSSLRTNFLSNLGANVLGITQESGAALSMSGNNTAFVGTVSVTRGNLEVSTNNTALGNAIVQLGDTTSGSTVSAGFLLNAGRTITNQVNVLAGSSGTLTVGALQNSTTLAGVLNLSNNVRLVNSTASNTFTLAGGTQGTGNISINASGGAISIGTAALNHSGTVTNISSGAGSIVIAGGVGPNVTGIIEAPTGSSGIIMQTTALTVNTNGTTLSNNSIRGFTVNSGIVGTGNLILANNSTAATAITFATTAVNNTGLIINNGTGTGGQLMASQIGANVTGIRQDSSTSILTLSADNSAGFGSTNGAATITAGVLKFGNTLSLGASNAVYINSGATLDTNNFVQTIAGLNDGVGAGTVTNTGTLFKTLTVGGSGNYSFSGSITASTLASMALTKSGAGLQVLGGTSTYTGATNINGGVLRLTGSLDSTSTLINSGRLEITGNGTTTGKLAGGVTIGDGTLTASARDATLAPGRVAVGTMVSGNLWAKADGIFEAQLDGTTASTADAALVTGTVTLNNGIALLNASYLTGTGGADQKYFVIINDNADAVVGYFIGLQDLNGAIATDDPLVLNANGYDLHISYTGDFGTAALTGGNDVVLYSVSATPEPGGLAVIAVGAAALLRRRRRQ